MVIQTPLIQLNNTNLYDYFAVASSRDSSTIADKKLFDFVDRGSDTLVIAIGDSWTWGADISQLPIYGSHLSRLEDDAYRVHNMYGNQLASRIEADFLGLGESGSGNWHLYKKIKELSLIQHRLGYDDIIVIGVFTEVGRDFNSHNDVHIDYRAWLLENVTGAADYDRFLGLVNAHICQAIRDIIIHMHPRYRFYFSTNFVDPIGHNALGPWFLDSTWLQVICSHNGAAYEPEHCYMVFPWVVEKFEAIFDMAPELDRGAWLSWINQMVDRANVRAQMCAIDDINFHQLLHPTARNHACWAEYLHGII